MSLFPGKKEDGKWLKQTHISPPPFLLPRNCALHQPQIHIHHILQMHPPSPIASFPDVKRGTRPLLFARPHDLPHEPRHPEATLPSRPNAPPIDIRRPHNRRPHLSRSATAALLPRLVDDALGLAVQRVIAALQHCQRVREVVGVDARVRGAVRAALPVGHEAGAGEVDEALGVRRARLRGGEAGEQSAQRGDVVGVAVVDDDVGGAGGGGQDLEAVVVAVEEFGVWIGCLEGGGGAAAEEEGVVVVRVVGVEGVEDAAADVAGSAGSVGLRELRVSR